MADFKFDPPKTALINIDMQNCFVENSPVAAPRGYSRRGEIRLQPLP